VIFLNGRLHVFSPARSATANPDAFPLRGGYLELEAIRSTTDNLRAGDRWLYRVDIVIVLCPAAARVSLMLASAMPAFSKHGLMASLSACSRFNSTSWRFYATHYSSHLFATDENQA
jgi:hypothetical protein